MWNSTPFPRLLNPIQGKYVLTRNFCLRLTKFKATVCAQFELHPTNYFRTAPPYSFFFYFFFSSVNSLKTGDYRRETEPEFQRAAALSKESISDSDSSRRIYRNLIKNVRISFLFLLFLVRFEVRYGDLKRGLKIHRKHFGTLKMEFLGVI